MIAFTTDTHNTWLMGPNGEQPRRIYKSDTSVEMFNFRFSPNGKRLLYTEYPDGVVEDRDLEGTAPVKVLTGVGDRINDYLWLADGRLVYSMAESTPNQNTCNLWELMVDERTGEPRGTPRRLTNWAGFCAGNLTATADGKQIAFQQWTGHASVYVADLKANGTRITTPTRLTFSDSWNVPSAWAADSKSVVFNSKFNGETRIFQQHLSEDSPHTLVDGMIDFSDHTPLTPDGSWFLIPSKAQSSPDEQWMRVPAIGGVPQPVPGLIMKGGSYGMRCARSPSTLCAIAERPLPTQLTFAAVDPLRGRGRELSTVNVDRESECSWDLSPDGTRLAVLEGLTGQIHIVHLNNQPAQEIRAEGMQSTNFVDWTADGKALLVSRPTRRGFELLRLDVNGKSHILWEQRGGLGTSALPSPDGKHLAIRGWSINSNLWLMQDF
jgi:Tol biopolymer transport system component